MNSLISTSSAAQSSLLAASTKRKQTMRLCAIYLLAQLASGAVFANAQKKAPDLSSLFDHTPLSFDAPPDSDPFTPRFFAIDIEKERDIAHLCWKKEQLPAQNLLENTALESISFRGSIQDKNGIWALINASDGLFYKIGVGQVLGSTHGKIDFISQSQVTVTEYVANEPDCWRPRTINWTLNR
ncbi:MAG: pilus assembly protein PilP [Vibrionaceae bacterium]